MSFALEAAALKYKERLESAGIRIDTRQNLIAAASANKVIKIPFNMPSGRVDLTVRRLLEHVERQEREKQQRKQTNLFEEN